MLEILKYVTSDIGPFLGSTIFCVLVISALGWSISRIILAIRGIDG